MDAVNEGTAYTMPTEEANIRSINAQMSLHCARLDMVHDVETSCRFSNWNNK